MPILITGSQTNLKKLTDGLLTKRASASQREGALLALMAANPGLDKRITKGTTVVVPPLPNARVDVTAVGTVVGADRLSDVSAAVAMLPSLLADNLEKTRARTDAAMRELEEVADAAIELKLARITKSDRDSIASAMTADIEAAEKLRQTFESAVTAWDNDLAVLREVLHRAG